MAKRNTLKQEYYKTTFNSYWKDSEGKPTIEYVNWLEDKLVKKLNIDDVSNQRELLIAFIESHHEKHHYSYPVSEIDVNEYLSNL